MELVLKNVSKTFGKKKAADDISLTLSPGITGLLGANGAGKTTLMRIISGILAPDCGSITLGGWDVKHENYRDALGYLPQDFGYYPSFSGRDFLMYVAALKGLSKEKASKKCDELLFSVGLSEKADKKIKTYSGGMKQRLGIAQALINEPRLLVLDEPTAGLDPAERMRFRNMIKTLGKSAAVLLSTHIVPDIEQIADRILIMKDGKIIRSGERSLFPENLEEYYLGLMGENCNE